MMVAGNREVTISLFAGENEQVSFEIYSADGEQNTIHCQGRAALNAQPAPIPVNIGELLAQMRRGPLDPDGVYAQFATTMGVHYGPSHRAITTLHQGEGQLLAQLTLPIAPAPNEGDGDERYFLHPGLVTGALQAGLRLAADATGRRETLSLPHGLKRLRVLAPCTGEMFAWARYAPGVLPDDERIQVDIDLLDNAGIVCAQMRGLSFQEDSAAAEAAVQPTWIFSNEQPSGTADGAHNGSMGAAEKIELFLRQETALQLLKPIGSVPTNQSYFDLGLTSLSIAHLIRNTNRLLDEDLSPSALFEYTDIESLATHLAETYAAKIDAVAVARRTDGNAHPVEQRRVHSATLTPLPRAETFAPRSVTVVAEEWGVAAAVLDLDHDEMLAQVLWPADASLDDSYEKVTF
jgi:hypothetical protein